jgi:hypothetical protein
MLTDVLGLLTGTISTSTVQISSVAILSPFQAERIRAQFSNPSRVFSAQSKIIDPDRTLVFAFSHA